jgi:hypothetical protein
MGFHKKASLEDSWIRWAAIPRFLRKCEGRLLDLSLGKSRTELAWSNGHECAGEEPRGQFLNSKKR